MSCKNFARERGVCMKNRGDISPKFTKYLPALRAGFSDSSSRS